MYRTTFLFRGDKCYGFQYAGTLKEAHNAAHEWADSAIDKFSTVAKVQKNDFGGISTVSAEEVIRSEYELTPQKKHLCFIQDLEKRHMSSWTPQELAEYSRLTGQSDQDEYADADTEHMHKQNGMK